MTRLPDDVRLVAVRQDSEPAGFDWTAAGARTFTLIDAQQRIVARRQRIHVRRDCP